MLARVLVESKAEDVFYSMPLTAVRPAGVDLAQCWSRTGRDAAIII